MKRMVGLTITVDQLIFLMVFWPSAGSVYTCNGGPLGGGGLSVDPYGLGLEGVAALS